MKLISTTLLCLMAWTVPSHARESYECTPKSVISVPTPAPVPSSDQYKYIDQCVLKFDIEKTRLQDLGFTILGETPCRYVNHPFEYGTAGAFGEITFLR